MGAQESIGLDVNFNHPDLFYFAGEQITGNISFRNTHDKLSVDEICLEVIGELGYRKEARPPLGDLDYPALERYTEHHRIPFMKILISVVQPPSGQHEIILNNGQYSWPFDFTLPNRLPPSIISSTDSHPYIKYYARIVLEKPWYKSDIKQVYPLTIFPRVDLLYTNGSQEKIPFSDTNRKKVRLNAYLLQGSITPSEKISVHINLQNPERSNIKRVEAVLIQHQQIAHRHDQETILSVDVPDLHEFDGIKFEETIDLAIPSPCLVPSYEFTAEFNQHTYPVMIKYELVLKVKSHGLLTDFDVKLPIIIGTERSRDQQQTNKSVEMLLDSASVPYCDEPPASYESVIPNQKT